MRFPFVAERVGRRDSVWGIAPVAGSVRIQALRGSAWKTIATVAAHGRGHPFTADLRRARGTQLRAQIDTERRLPWKPG
jgi:hypothetical protein